MRNDRFGIIGYLTGANEGDLLFLFNFFTFLHNCFLYNTFNALQ